MSFSVFLSSSGCWRGCARIRQTLLSPFVPFNLLSFTTKAKHQLMHQRISFKGFPVLQWRWPPSFGKVSFSNIQLPELTEKCQFTTRQAALTVIVIYIKCCLQKILAAFELLLKRAGYCKKGWFAILSLKKQKSLIKKKRIDCSVTDMG